MDSTEAHETVRKRHFEVVQQALGEEHQYLKGPIERQKGDEVKAEFKDPWHAIKAAFRVHDRTRALADGLMERIGLDAGPVREIDIAETNAGEVGRDYYQTVSRCSRIMELCADGYILCSDDFLGRLEKSRRDALEVHGPIFVKLKGFVRPVAVHFIGKSLKKIDIWQSKRIGPAGEAHLALSWQMWPTRSRRWLECIPGGVDEP